MTLRFIDRFDWTVGDAEIYDRRGDFIYPVKVSGAYHQFTDWRGEDYLFIESLARRGTWTLLAVQPVIVGIGQPAESECAA